MNDAKSFKENGYLIIPKILSGELLDFIGIYAYNLARIEGIVSADSQIPNTPAFYGDMVMETLLTKLHPLMETETETKLHSTYSYARLYKKGDVLERHTDRASCKISTTLNLGGDPWPIFLEPSRAKGEKGISVLLESGDMLLYDGVNHEHWREAFEGESCGQVFLHYRDDKENECDGRPFLGLPVTFKGSRV